MADPETNVLTPPNDPDIAEQIIPVPEIHTEEPFPAPDLKIGELTRPNGLGIGESSIPAAYLPVAADAVIAAIPEAQTEATVDVPALEPPVLLAPDLKIDELTPPNGLGIEESIIPAAYLTVAAIPLTQTEATVDVPGVESSVLPPPDLKASELTAPNGLSVEEPIIPAAAADAVTATVIVWETPQATVEHETVTVSETNTEAVQIQVDTHAIESLVLPAPGLGSSDLAQPSELTYQEAPPEA